MNTKYRTLKLLSIQITGYRGYILQEYQIPSFCDLVEKLLGSGFTSPPALSKYPDREVFRLRINSGDFKNPWSFKEVYIKRYHVTNLKQKLQTLFYTHKAQKSWRIGRILLKKGILTPRPIAYLTRQTSFVSGEQILITEGIPNGLSLRDYVRKYVQSSKELQDNKKAILKKRELIRSVAEFLGRLHLARVYHGDFTAGNIFIERIQDSSESPLLGQTTLFQVYLIDLDSVRSTFWITSRRRIKNLDELGRNFLDLQVFSTSDRIRFLKYYLNTYIKESKTFRELFNEVFQRTQFRLKKHHQLFLRSEEVEKSRC